MKPWQLKLYLQHKSNIEEESQIKQSITHTAYIKANTDESTNSVAQEPEGSSSHSQQLAAGLYPEPVESNPQLPLSEFQ
jgi:hypothetical protein